MDHGYLSNPWEFFDKPGDKYFYAELRQSPASSMNIVSRKDAERKAKDPSFKAQGEYPMGIDSKFSRLVLGINGDGKQAKGTVSKDMIPHLLAASRFAFNEHMRLLHVAEAEDQRQLGRIYKAFTAALSNLLYFMQKATVSMFGAAFPDVQFPPVQVRQLTVKNSKSSVKYEDAYQVKLNCQKAFPQIHGKTPAEAILEDPKNADSVRKQMEWLQKNSTGKYAASNKRIADACAHALEMYEEGSLKEQEASSFSVPIPILEIPNRINIYEPSKTQAFNDCVLNWSMSIIYRAGATKVDAKGNEVEADPVEVKITNFYAPYIRTDKGLINPDGRKLQDPRYKSFRDSTFVEYTVRLSAQEWCLFCDLLERNRNAFASNTYTIRMKDAEACERDNKAEYRQRPNNSPYGETDGEYIVADGQVGDYAS